MKRIYIFIYIFFFIFFFADRGRATYSEQRLCLRQRDALPYVPVNAAGRCDRWLFLLSSEDVAAVLSQHALMRWMGG